MTDHKDLNARGNKNGSFTQGVGGWAEYTVNMTEVSDRTRHDVKLPPGKVIPVIFLPGVMGSNLRMSKKRQDRLDRNDNRSWRPDDMVSVGGGVGVVTGTGFAGWYKNASPAQRQLNFDPNETEVEYYHYTENAGRFDPDGSLTLAADARHKNIPNSMGAIPPLLGSNELVGFGRIGKNKNATPAQVARWRGWSEVMYSGAYGEVLRTAERLLNNIVEGDEIHRFWRKVPKNRLDSDRKRMDPRRKLMEMMLMPPTEFGASSGGALTEQEIRRISPCWYPVHAMGYNFLKSNGESAIAVADRIRGLVSGYRKRKFQCDEVIIITHSMGGLLGRALLHPSYGNLAADPSLKVLGMYHSAMPAAGAAATYKRMRFGFAEGTSWLAETQARLFGIDGRNATAVLANTPGPLELLPADVYGGDWIRVVSAIDEPVMSWPSAGANALEDIYVQPESAWWRLINPIWINPANVDSDRGGGLEKVFSRLQNAFGFTNAIKETFHQSNCWVSYCSSAKRRTYGEVVFAIMNFDVYGEELKKLPPAATWKLLSDDGRGRLQVQAGSRKLILQLKRPNAKGDETVPAKRSAQIKKGVSFMHGQGDHSDYEHQNSYADDEVLAAMMYSIVKIAASAKWDDS